MRALILAALLAQAGPALAELSLTAEEFEAQVTGKTVTYSRFGRLFGTEEYLEGRQVRWSVAEDRCLYGHWFPQDREICFVYEDSPSVHCWTFWEEDGRLVALGTDAEPEDVLFETARSDTPLACPGPDVGV